MAQNYGTAAGIARLLREVEALLKQPSVGLDLGRGGINTSIALLAVQGLTAYVEGNAKKAQEDFATVAEEIQSRLGQR